MMLIDFSVCFLNDQDWQAVLFSSFAVTQQDTEAAIEKQLWDGREGNVS